MTDKELLVLAAKAVGYVRMVYRDKVPYVSDKLNGGDFVAWNPLISDGDALRLVVKLGILVVVDDIGVSTQVVNFGFWDENFKVNEDRYAKTRRTIVRAAAEIGRAN